MDILTLMTAAICHDLDHPGYNNTCVGDFPPSFPSRGALVSEVTFPAPPQSSSESELRPRPHHPPPRPPAA